MTPITLWSRMLKNDEGTLAPIFNHVETSHCENDVPTPMHEIHKKVWGGKWAKEHAHLDDSVPPVVIHN